MNTLNGDINMLYDCIGGGLLCFPAILRDGCCDLLLFMVVRFVFVWRGGSCVSCPARVDIPLRPLRRGNCCDFLPECFRDAGQVL